MPHESGESRRIILGGGGGVNGFLSFYEHEPVFILCSRAWVFFSEALKGSFLKGIRWGGERSDRSTYATLHALVCVHLQFPAAHSLWRRKKLVVIESEPATFNFESFHMQHKK